MQSTRLDTHQKAVQINLDNTKYGTFAEIGAGQEVARWFFRVGGAAGTIAKSISAYDMTVSDAIYGACDRYVSRQRLETMLDYEYRIMIERLAAKRGESTRFFVFADTVVARSYTRKDNCHGWMGIQFQARPDASPSRIILHVSLLDRETVAQQEAMGILGVNLIHSAIYEAEPVAVVRQLLDDLSSERIEVDLIEFSGPDFAHVDNRLMSLELVHCGLSNAAMFTSKGKVVQPAEVFYKRPILVSRGSFRPVTNVTVDMLSRALAQFSREPANQREKVLVVTEMTLNNLVEGDAIDNRDFLDRVDILRTLGHPVLISNFGEFYRLANFLQRHTTKLIGLVMGVGTLQAIFEEKYYADLAGGILESFGRLFKNDLKLYSYPLLDLATGVITTADDLRVAPHLQHLYQYLVENHHIQPIRDYNAEFLTIFSRDVLRRMREGDPSWVDQVPPGVALLICQSHMLGYDPEKFEVEGGNLSASLTKEESGAVMSTPPHAVPQRRRFTVSIRTLMLIVLISGLWLGWTFNGANTRRKAVEALKKNGAIVLYDYESMGAIKPPTVSPRAPAWLRKAVGDDCFQTVTYANLTPAVGRKYRLTDIDLAPLAALDRIEELAIVNTSLTDSGLTHLEGLIHLRRLYLFRLDQIGNPGFTDSGLARLSGMTELQELGLDGANVTDAGLAGLSRMTDLKSLNLMRTQVTGPGLAHLSRMTKLKFLALARNPLTDDGLVHVRGLTSLQELWLYGTKTTHAGLVNLEPLKSLRKLNLGPENSTDAGLAHLAGLTSLQELDLPGNGVTDAGLAHLAQLKNLKELCIYDAAITDAGLVNLSGLPNLQVLALTGASRLTDAGLAHLRGLTRLKRLHVDQSQVSDQGLVALKAELPLLVKTTNTKPPAPATGKSKGN